MRLITAFGDPPPEEAIEIAVTALTRGALVAIPTDTVYGIAADPFHTGGTERLFAAKRRSRDMELPVIVADVKDAIELAEGVPDSAHALMERYWPGALTIVLPRRADLEADLGSDDATIGIRCPDHPVVHTLCRAMGPLATTSANISGQPTPPTAEQVAGVFGELLAVVLDGGSCEGSASTVVDCTGPEVRLLRAGRIPWDELTDFLSSP